MSLQWRHAYNERDDVSNHRWLGWFRADQRKHQSSASLAFVREIHRWPVNFPHKGPITRKMFLFDDARHVFAGVAAKLQQAIVLDVTASRVKCLAQFILHFCWEICLEYIIKYHCLSYHHWLQHTMFCLNTILGLHALIIEYASSKNHIKWMPAATPPLNK